MKLAAVLLLAALAARAEIAIVIESEAGIIEATLDDRHAPVTVANFLRYVDAGHYLGGAFYRTVRSKPDNQPMSPVKIDVIQAGIKLGTKDPYPPIALERTSKTGLLHADGALSMARGDKADSATSSFFICVGPQPSLDFGGKRNPDGQGFAVFGRVTKGMDVVRRIHAAPAGPSGAGAAAVAQGDQRLTPFYAIRAIRRK
ncbi:MAG: peptidylprolyl isomerase [Bryobacterales bacterium]|nr:peptidylprolyl isomerase [Bryobacterales bacterium]